MRRRRVVLGCVGAGLTIIALAAALAPGSLLGLPLVGPFVGTAAGLGETALVIGGVAAGLAAAVLTLGNPEPEPATDADRRFVLGGDQEPTEASVRPAGAEFDSQVERAASDGGAPLVAVRERLREVAVEVRVRRQGSDRDAARHAVEAGRWTDDRLAAAFLADGAPAPPVRARLRLWLAPGRERKRRIERTVAAVERLGGDQ